jgi:hypothetical protein
MVHLYSIDITGLIYSIISKYKHITCSISLLQGISLIKSAEYLCELSTDKTEWGIGQKGTRETEQQIKRERENEHWSENSFSIGQKWP